MDVERVDVIGPQYCAPYAVDLSVFEQVIVLDANQNVVFSIKRKVFSLRER